MVGCPLAAAAVSSCWVEPDRWSVPHLAVGAHFDCGRSTCRATQPVQRAPLWRASWLLAVDKSRGSKSVEVQRVWEIYGGRLQFMSRHDVIRLDESLRVDDVSRAWLVWSGAAEGALADACRFAGGPVPSRGLVLVRGVVLGFVLLGWVDLGFVRRVVVLLMCMRMVMSSCIVTLLF